MHHFVYITTNLINGKQYVGDHSTNNIKDRYLGSGVYFKHALNEYGKENFKREILEYFEAKEEAFIAQEKYIQQYNTLFPSGYNISPKGGHNVKGCISEETKKKISNTEKGKKQTNESKQKISNATLGENNGMYGKKHSKEAKYKCSINHAGGVTHHSEETILKIKEKNRGQKRLPETGEKIRKKLLGKKQSEETKQKRKESLNLYWQKKKNIL